MNIKDLPRAYYWPTLLALAIFAASGSHKLAVPDLGFQIYKDKLAHFLVFGLLATSILRTPKLAACQLKHLIIAAAMASGYGALDEFRQSLTQGRMVELADWFANTAGAIVAVLVYKHWALYRTLLEVSPIRFKFKRGARVQCPASPRRDTPSVGLHNQTKN